MTSLIVGGCVLLLVVSNIATLVMLYNAYEERKSLMAHIHLLDSVIENDDKILRELEVHIAECKRYLNSAGDAVSSLLFVSSTRHVDNHIRDKVGL